ncbi:MAG: hypothetical protein K2X78_10570 [Burkholderiaceae bacterium]|nr:hypothetical protein [Burkholderiaceae bacterium]
MLYTTLGKAATYSPAKRSCAAPCLVPSASAVGIAMEDWHLLFGAVTETLARAVSEKESVNPAGFRLETRQEVVADCMKALDQLRRSVPNALPNRVF